ncbi:MAG: regulatory protein RecX [Bacteroidota bacterium]|nr:regulatory protein RecX [Bacteroidota bacterium]
MNDFNEILKKIQKYCAFSERCEFEVMTKLKTYKTDQPTAVKIIKSLRDDNFINDERYATSFASGKLNYNKWGRIKISYELKAKKIPDQIIDKALSKIEEDKYNAILEKLLKAKYQTIIDEDQYKRNAKLVSYAVSKGFETELVWKIINKLKN